MAVHREDPGKGTPREKEHHGTKRERARHAASEETEQLIFTLNAATGVVVKIEKADTSGKRHEIPQNETDALAGKGNLHEIEAALDEAFEAGISSVLASIGGDGSHDEIEEAEETEEEKELRRVLLTHIIGREVRRRLQRRLVQRLILSQKLAH